MECLCLVSSNWFSWKYKSPVHGNDAKVRGALEKVNTFIDWYTPNGSQISLNWELGIEDWWVHFWRLTCELFLGLHSLFAISSIFEKILIPLLLPKQTCSLKDNNSESVGAELSLLQSNVIMVNRDILVSDVEFVRRANFGTYVVSGPSDPSIISFSQLSVWSRSCTSLNACWLFNWFNLWRKPFIYQSSLNTAASHISISCPVLSFFIVFLNLFGDFA